MAKKKNIDEALFDPTVKGIIDTVAPMSIEFRQNYFTFGTKKIRAYGITQYTPNPRQAWLADIMNLKNTIDVLTFEPEESGQLLMAIGKNLNLIRGEANATRDYVQKQRLEQGIANGEKIIRRLDRTSEQAGRFSFVALVYGETEEEFKTACKNFESKCAGMNLRVKCMSNLQEQALMSAYPTYMPHPDVMRATQRIMTQSAYQLGMPTAASTFSDDSGMYLGRDINGGPIILDFWKRKGDRTNSNVIVMGMPGKGKSFAVKSQILSQAEKGVKFYIMDPETEYVEMVTEELEGEVLHVGANSRDSRINPLQIRNMSETDDESCGLISHMKTVETFFNYYLENMTETQNALLKDVILNVYADFGINFSTDTSGFANDQFPIISDVYEKIQEYIADYESGRKRLVKSEALHNDFVQLEAQLKDIAVGADSFIWNGATTIHSDNAVVCLDTSGFSEGNEKLKKIQYYNVLTWVWEQASRNRNEKCVIIADEAYMLIDERVPTALIYLRNIAKRGRKYNVGLWTISHSVVDFLSPAVKQYGQEILGTATYKFFFGCEGQNLAELAKLYSLGDAEREWLSAAPKGQALAQFGSKRIVVNFQIDPKKAARISGGGL